MANAYSLFALLQFGALRLSNTEALVKLEGLVGYQFKTRNLLEMACTHGSRKNKQMDYQRLEFLGDRVLSLVIAQELYERHADEREGKLAARLSLLVRAESCAAVGQVLGLEEFILLGTQEKRKGVHQALSVISDVVEALIGAIYLDGGYAPAQQFILHNWQDMLTKSQGDLKDAKSFVQEWALARAMPLPVYALMKREGSEHAPVFTIGLRVGELNPAEGQGHSKQVAEMAAANAFITREGLR
jgi:ribonuclease III